MKTEYFKLAIFGEVGAGKTCLIETLSEINPLNTDVESSIKIDKLLTTVGIDYGRIYVDKTMALGLYGCPGQERYSFIWEMVLPSLWGVVIMVKANTLNNKDFLLKLLDFFYPKRTNAPCVIALTHTDMIAESDVAKLVQSLQQILTEKNIIAPVIMIDARNKTSAMDMLHVMCAQHQNYNH